MLRVDFKCEPFILPHWHSTPRLNIFIWPGRPDSEGFESRGRRRGFGAEVSRPAGMGAEARVAGAGATRDCERGSSAGVGGCRCGCWPGRSHRVRISDSEIKKRSVKKKSKLGSYQMSVSTGWDFSTAEGGIENVKRERGIVGKKWSRAEEACAGSTTSTSVNQNLDL